MRRPRAEWGPDDGDVERAQGGGIDRDHMILFSLVLLLAVLTLLWLVN